MNVLPGVSRESDGGHEVTDFGLSIKLKRQRSVHVGNGASRKSDIPNEVGVTFSDVQRAEGADGLMLSAFSEAVLPFLILSEDDAVGDVIRSLRRMSAP